MVELRAMAMQPHEQMETWIKFASLCRKSDRHELTRTSLSKLLTPDSCLITLPVRGQLEVLPSPWLILVGGLVIRFTNSPLFRSTR